MRDHYILYRNKGEYIFTPWPMWDYWVGGSFYTLAQASSLAFPVRASSLEFSSALKIFLQRTPPTLCDLCPHNGGLGVNDQPRLKKGKRAKFG